jgi:ribosomal protein L17
MKSKRVIVVILCVLGGLGILLGGYWFTRTQSTRVYIPETNIEIEVPRLIKVQALSEQDLAAQILFRALNTKDENQFLITVRKEEGLRKAAALSRTDVLSLVVGNLEKAYPQRFGGYKKISENSKKFGSHEGTEITFTYNGPSGETIAQRILVLPLDGNSVIYLTAQAQEQHFRALNSHYFERIFSHIRFIGE